MHLRTTISFAWHLRTHTHTQVVPRLQKIFFFLIFPILKTIVKLKKNNFRLFKHGIAITRNDLGYEECCFLCESVLLKLLILLIGIIGHTHRHRHSLSLSHTYTYTQHPGTQPHSGMFPWQSRLGSHCMPEHLSSTSLCSSKCCFFVCELCVCLCVYIFVLLVSIWK